VIPFGLGTFAGKLEGNLKLEEEVAFSVA